MFMMIRQPTERKQRKKKFNLYSRRNDSEPWTPWINTGKEVVCKRHIKYIESYGWQWEVR